MASRNTTVRTSDAEELSWDQCDWPTSGRYRDLFWAAKNGMTVRMFREWLFETGIPYRRVGTKVWVDAADMDRLPTHTGSPPPQRTPTKQRKKRTTDGQAKGPQTRKR